MPHRTLSIEFPRPQIKKDQILLRCLNSLRKRYSGYIVYSTYTPDEGINDLDRWLLGLAAYNAGPSRVIAMRNEAKQKGYDRNIWFDNVEIIAAKRIGSETVTYVSNIFKYYTGYQMAYAKLNESDRRFGDAVGACAR